jgi:hypothetical protein
MWSYAHDVTLFSAGANNPSRGSGGTAVHRGTQGTVYQTIVAQGGSQAYLYESIDGRVTPPAEEDVDSVSREMDSVQLLTDNSLPDFLSVPLNTSDENYEAEVCHGEDENQFCCKLTLKTLVRRTRPELRVLHLPPGHLLRDSLLQRSLQRRNRSVRGDRVSQLFTDLLRTKISAVRKGPVACDVRGNNHSGTLPDKRQQDVFS